MEHDLSFIDKSNLSWLKKNTIFLTVVGSQSYGLATPESDYDFKGIAIPPKQFFFGIQNKFEQAEFGKPDPDCCIFNLQKWLSLAVENNPSVIEILWTDPEFYIITSKYWDKIIEHRDSFLSKNVRWRFSGYGISQLKKMKKHYRWLHNPMTEPPKRSDFGLPEHFVLPEDQMLAAFALIQQKLDGWNPDLGVDESLKINIINKVTDVMTDICGASLYLEKNKLWLAAATSLGLDSNFIEIIQKEKEYKSKKAEWDSYVEWKKHRNTKRAAAEAKVGYDAKDASAVIRIMKVAKEILSTCEVNVRRTDDREELLSIKRGEWEYEKVIEYGEQLEASLEELYNTTKLPKEPNRKLIDKISIEIVEEFLSSNEK